MKIKNSDVLILRGHEHVCTVNGERFSLKNPPKCDIISKGSLLGIVKIHAVW